MSIYSSMKKIESLCEDLGFSVDHKTASTGSIYMTVCRFGAIETDTVVVRFADHVDAYGNSDYTADGFEGTTTGARAFILAKMHTTERAVRRLRRARRNAEHRELSETHERWVRAYAAQRGVNIEEAVAASPFRYELPARFHEVTA